MRWIYWGYVICLVQVESAFFELLFQLEDLWRRHEIIFFRTQRDKSLTASMSASGPVNPSNNAALNVRIYRASSKHKVDVLSRLRCRGNVSKSFSAAADTVS